MKMKRNKRRRHSHRAPRLRPSHPHPRQDQTSFHLHLVRLPIVLVLLLPLPTRLLLHNLGSTRGSGRERSHVLCRQRILDDDDTRAGVRRFHQGHFYNVCCECCDETEEMMIRLSTKGVGDEGDRAYECGTFPNSLSALTSMVYGDTMCE